jgi:hypothetical protein
MELRCGSLGKFFLTILGILPINHHRSHPLLLLLLRVQLRFPFSLLFVLSCSLFSTMILLKTGKAVCTKDFPQDSSSIDRINLLLVSQRPLFLKTILFAVHVAEAAELYGIMPRFSLLYFWRLMEQNDDGDGLLLLCKLH